MTKEIPKKNKGGRPKKKHAGGRPTVMTPEVMRKLEEAFSWGCPDVEACLYANISKRTLYEYQNKNPEFVHRKEALKDMPALNARRNWANKIIDNDYSASKDYLERKKKGEFSLRQEHTGKDGDKIEIVITGLDDE